MITGPKTQIITVMFGFINYESMIIYTLDGILVYSSLNKTDLLKNFSSLEKPI